MSSKQLILQYLQQHPFTPAQLQKKTKLPASSLRARISELRKLGYDIQKNNGTYTLTSTLESYIKSKNQYNKPIDINTIASDLHLPLDTITLEISKLFHRYQILQLSKDTIKILK